MCVNVKLMCILPVYNYNIVICECLCLYINECVCAYIYNVCV